jgi:hypothetical protein
MKVDLLLNLGHGIRKSKAKTRCARNVNAKKNVLKKYEKNITRSWQKYIFKTSVEHIKNDVELYLY